jgi:phosphopantothenoylcysteine decarboxylase/phosphopantothenate--cysteine ligase
MNILQDKRILLGVTGSIAAYKAADLASRLTQAGALVDVLLTAAGEKFISALTFQSVTGRPAFADQDLWGGQAHVLHVGLGGTADLLVIAPCTAETLAKLAHGNADNLLTVTALAARCPLVIAPAMDGGMFAHPATQANLSIVKGRGVTIAGPASGHLASGLEGPGRMLEPAEIVGHIRLALGARGRLAGRKVVVTAGGTREPLDPVRVLANHSSGKQGYALAQAALDCGAQVVLIEASTALPAPVGAQLVEVQTVQQMLEAVLAESAGVDALIMAAAPADFRPRHVAADKLKRRDGVPAVELEAAPDILKAVADQLTGKRRPRLVVGFAAESRDLLANAADKLKSKKLDLIAANDISLPDAGFGSDTNRVTLLFRDGRQEALPIMRKSEVAELVIEKLAQLLEA